MHLEPAKHISADVTSRGVTGEQGGTEQEREKERETERESEGGRMGVRKEGWGRKEGAAMWGKEKGGVQSDRRRTLYNDRMGGE